MRRNFPSLFLFLAATTVSNPVWAAAPCPANPLAVLSGNWTFNIQADLHETFTGNNYAIAGTFAASIGADRGGNPIGVLQINATSLINHSSTRLENDIGRFQINADCSGGTLTLNLSSRPMQYDFWFYNGNQSINIVSSTDGKPATGTAHLGTNGCPAGLTNPLVLLSGPYAFRLAAPWLNLVDPIDQAYLISGRFVADNGSLRITASSQLTQTSSVTRLERDAGSYQINSDCSGGTLTFNLSSRPIQLQFYFRAGFDTLDIISTTGPAATGIAHRAPLAGCPANPLTTLNGAWTYNVHGLLVINPPGEYSATGQFRASIGTDRAGNPVGLLAINATSVQALSITRLEGDVGRYQINEDCTGGTLTFNLSSFPQQYDFWFHNGGILVISTLNGRPGVGGAWPAPTSCPAGVSPLGLLTGPWSYRVRNLQAVTGLANLRFPAYLTQAGIMTGSVSVDRGGNPLGVLAVTATSAIGPFGSVARYETDAGRYQVNADCTGGTLTMNLSSQPAQYEFYFRAGFNEFDAIGTSVNGPFVQGLFSR